MDDNLTDTEFTVKVFAEDQVDEINKQLQRIAVIDSLLSDDWGFIYNSAYCGELMSIKDEAQIAIFKVLKRCDLRDIEMHGDYEIVKVNEGECKDE